MLTVIMKVAILVPVNTVGMYMVVERRVLKVVEQCIIIIFTQSHVILVVGTTCIRVTTIQYALVGIGTSVQTAS